jgi:hypothetical protein
LWTIHAAAIGEAMVAASAWASSPTSGGAPDSARRPTAFVLRHDVPSIFAGHYDPSFPIALYLKDLGLVDELTVETEVRNELARATLERFKGPEAEGIAEALLNAPGFDASFERLLQAGVKDAAFVYAGDLAEGEAYEGQLTEQVGDWSIVGLSDRHVSLIVDATIKVSVEVQYEDRDSASYDREDGVWIGAEDAAMQVEDEAEVAVLVEIGRASGEVVGGELLTGYRQVERTPGRGRAIF